MHGSGYLWAGGRLKVIPHSDWLLSNCESAIVVFRREGPSSALRYALWTTQSRMLSASVGSGPDRASPENVNKFESAP